jgi:SNF2 family DNA or RNA helicase
MPMKLPDKPLVKVPLFKHQEDGWRRALNELVFGGGGFGLLYEMGCGKTLTAIAIMGSLWEMGLLRRVLIVAPSSVCSVWPREFDKFADFPVECIALTGSSAKRREQLTAMTAKRVPALQVAVVNYEGAWRLPSSDKKTNVLRDFNPGLVLCDESHRIKKHTARQSKFMHLVGDAADFRMILTGTPIQNNPLDIYSQYRFLDPNVFGKSYMKFRSRYAVMGGFAVNGKPVQIVSYKHLDELNSKAYSCAMRVTKD